VSCSTVDTTLNLAQICSQPPPVCDNNTCTVTNLVRPYSVDGGGSTISLN
jgi:hypothetical protein